MCGPNYIRRSLWCQQDAKLGSAKVLLAPGKQWCWEVVPALRHLCIESSTPAQESGPNASIHCRGPVGKDNHWCSSALPTERPRKPVPPDCYVLVCEVAGSLYYSQPRGFDSGVSGYYQLLLSLQSTAGATQWPRRAPRPCTRSRTACCNATSKRSRSTHGGLSHQIRWIGPHDYPSSSWLTGHPLTALRA
jgi:hypothetical protein